MSELYSKSLHKLELNQVLELLAECAGSLEGKAACRNLRPTSDLEDVRLMLDQTTAASDLCTKKGNPGFGEVRDAEAVPDQILHGQQHPPCVFNGSRSKA